MGNIAKTMTKVHHRQKRNKRLMLLFVAFIVAGELAVGLLLDLDPLKVRFWLGKSVVEDLVTTSRHPDILFLGSSRFANGIIIDEFQRGMQETFDSESPLMVRCVIPGGDPYSMDFMLRRIISSGVTPGMVVMEISPETVMLAGPFLDYQVTRFMTWKEIPDAAEDLIAHWKFSRLVASRLVPIYLYRYELLTYLLGCSPPYLKPPPPPPPADTGQNPTSIAVEKPDYLKEIQSQKPAIQKWFRNYRIGGLNVQHLESMLAYFKAHDIATILVGVPVTKAHFENYSEKIDRQFLDYMDTVVRNYGCSFADYRDRMPDDFFFDIQHLTRDGGTEFSRIFQKEVLCDAWRKCSKELKRAGRPSLHGS